MPSSPTPLSGSANDQAQPELVVASALKPAACSHWAEPTSQGLGMTKQPDSCSRRKLARRSAMEAAMGGGSFSVGGRIGGGDYSRAGARPVASVHAILARQP